ncbi:MAG: Hsp20/alpha crystallin family protein [Candidatus Omnitrophica bacterium]|nr:Hsp20/alpha crystallin family protein [Candidatus Omnitrophota bacterium]
MIEQEKKSADRQRWLVGLVAILSLGLVLESVFLWKMSRDFKAPARKLEMPHPRPVAGSWDPFEEMDRMQERIDRLFRDSFNRGRGSSEFSPWVSLPEFEPDADLRETRDGYVAVFDLPGLEKDRIKVEVNENALIVSGERQSASEQESEGYYQAERSFGSFQRVLPLPTGVDPENVQAAYENGVLTVKLAKRQAKSEGAGKTRIAVE